VVKEKINMGYCMQQRDSVFFIAKKDVPKALKAIKSLVGKERIADSSGPHFSWVDTTGFTEAKTLSDALNAWRWSVEEDADGNVVAIQFEGQKLGDDGLLFKAISPFVKKGSYIEMSGDESAIWRWVFDGRKCAEKDGKVVFD
jgi:hypothetical protein